MKFPIKYKLLIYMIASILLFALILLFSNMFFSEKYYFSRKTKRLMEISKEVENTLDEYADIVKNMRSKDANIITEQEKKWMQDIARIEQVSNQSVVIYDDDYKMIYPINERIYLALEQGIAEYTLIPEETTAQEATPSFEVFPSVPVDAIMVDESMFQKIQGDDSSEILYTKNKILDIENLTLIKNNDQGFKLSLSMPLASISENITILNQFVTIIGIISIGITIILAFFIANKFTKPITLIQKSTEKMKKLDFDDKIAFTSNDELGQLANDINFLSEKLSLTIGQLNEQNKKLEQDIDRERKIDSVRRDFIANVSHELKTPIF